MATMGRAISVRLLRDLSSKPSPRLLFAHNFQTESKNDNSSFETADEFEKRLFGSNTRGSSADSAFYRKLDRIEKAHDLSYRRPSGTGFRSRSDGYGGGGGGDREFSDTLNDGMDYKLRLAATAEGFDDDTDEDFDDGFGSDDNIYRPDIDFAERTTYTLKDLDVTKPASPKARVRRPEFETTTAEVLNKADFRNVRFLANFLTEAGIIIKRSQTKISAKAQRKVAREIKTARAFGLMPFTTMGTKKFIFGRSMEDLGDEYEYGLYHNRDMTNVPAEQDEPDKPDKLDELDEEI